MPVFCVTGKTGQGKGLCAVGMARRYLSEGRTIATNMDLFPEHFRDVSNKNIRIIRIPDRPTAADLYALGMGNEEPWDEEKNGLLLLDELVTWFNSRSWQDKDRKALIDWFVHRRKYGWDIAFQAQSMSSLDGQLRDNVIDYECRAVKVKTIRIPVISALYRKLFDKPMMWPKFMWYHCMKMHNVETDMIDDVHRFRGQDIYPLYNTAQVIQANYPHGMHSLLTPWHLVGRYGKSALDFRYLVRMAIRLPLVPVIMLSSCLDKESRQYFAKIIAKPSE